MLTDQEKWAAVLHCDNNYDGRFFYGVKTTGVFCRPSCKSKPPRPENVDFFSSPEEAAAKGLRPCKRCRPDLLSYQPSEDILRQAANIVSSCFDDQAALGKSLNDLSISRSQLDRLFRQQFGATIAEYTNELRIKKAAAKLGDHTQSVLTIAFHCGFGSLSSFYYCFKKRFGITPGEYRRNQFRQ